MSWKQRQQKRRQWRRQQKGDGAALPVEQAANVSSASRWSLLEMVEVCFLAMGRPTQVDYAVSIIRNIEAHATKDVRYHMLVDKPPAPLEAQMRERAVWRGLPMERVRLQSVEDISAAAKTLYRALSATATGPGGLYLYKPLLHLVLPRTVSRVIVLDTDLFLFSSLRGLWDLFGRFSPPQLIGLAQARPPAPPTHTTHPPTCRTLAASYACPTHRPAGAGRSNARRTKKCVRWVGAATMAACSCLRSTRCAPPATTSNCSGGMRGASCQ